MTADTGNVARRPPIWIHSDPISDQPALFSARAAVKNRRQTTLFSQLNNKPAVGAVFSLETGSLPCVPFPSNPRSHIPANYKAGLSCGPIGAFASAVFEVLRIPGRSALRAEWVPPDFAMRVIGQPKERWKAAEIPRTYRVARTSCPRKT